MLTRNQIGWARKRLQKIVNPLQIRLSYGKEDDFCQKLEEVAMAICGLSDRLQLVKEFLPEKDGPAILHVENIHYAAIPEGREFEPFVETLVEMSMDRDHTKEEGWRSVGDVKGPITIQLAISPSCPHCPSVVRKVDLLAVANREIQVFIQDVSLFDDIREKLAIRSTPTLILNGRIRLTGYITDEVLLQAVREQESQETIELALRSQIRSGDIEEAIQTFLLQPEIASLILARIMGEGEFEMRLGAMLLLEEMAKKGKHLVVGAISELKGLLSHPMAAIRGDACDLLGKIGHKGIIGDLERLLEDPDPDVAECAREVIQELFDS